LLLLPLASRGQSRDILFALGEIAESTAQSARSADFYLRAALADETRLADALAVQARLAAAANLERAGFRDDARAQLQWVIANSRDARQTETARRRLSTLATSSR
jgi:predicted negative regulator of RcsB-dependent stress response